MTVQALRHALTHHLGQALTPEVAAAIEREFHEFNAQPIDISGLAQKRLSDGYTIQAERFASILPDLHELLHVEHWQETERHRHGLRLRPDYMAMSAMEDSGRLLQFTLRAPSGELAGGLRMFLSKSLHTQTNFASEDAIFIRAQHRGGMRAIALMRYAEAALLSIGIREIRANTKLVNHADVLMRRLGYSPVATEFVKFFQENTYVR